MMENKQQPDKLQTTWDPRQYERAAGFVAGELGMDLLDWFAPESAGPDSLAGRRVLDLGCGDGELSRRLIERQAVVTGVDSSPEMIAAAKDRGVEALVGDARNVGEIFSQGGGFSDPIKSTKGLETSHAFDVVFTNATLHWIEAKDQVVAGVRRILKSGGRFVGEFGGGANVRLVRNAMRAAWIEMGRAGEPEFPWYFITDAEFQKILEANGFRVRRILMFETRPVLREGVVGWLETFGSTIVANLSPDEKQTLWRRTQELLESQLFYDGVWHADYVRLRFEAEPV